MPEPARTTWRRDAAMVALALVWAVFLAVAVFSVVDRLHATWSVLGGVFALAVTEVGLHVGRRRGVQALRAETADLQKALDGLADTIGALRVLTAEADNRGQRVEEAIGDLRAVVAEVRDGIYDLGFADGFEVVSGGRRSIVTKLPSSRTGTDGSPLPR